MYTIYTDGKLMYDPSLFHEGYGVITPKVTVEINKAGSLEFKMPPNNVYYGKDADGNDLIKKLKSILTVFQNGKEIFRGRALSADKDFYKQKTVYCEGELAFLLDSVQRPYTFNGPVANLFRQYINNHNSRVDIDKRFTVGEVSLDYDETITCSNYDYPNTFDEITEKILNVAGGRLRIRIENNVRYIDLIADEKDDGDIVYGSQVIEFGRNLLDITEHITAEDIYTVVVPVGAPLTIKDDNGNETQSNEKLNIASVNDGKDYIENTTAVKLFGRIEKKIEYTEIKNATELLTQARKDLNKNIEMSLSLTVSAVDLHLLDADVDAIEVGSWVRVISLPHELDTYFKCTKIIYHLDQPESTTYSFGVDTKTLTDQQVSDKKSMQSSVSMVLSTAGAVNASVNKANASADKANQANDTFNTIITQIPTDYVSTSTFDAYKSEVTEDFQSIQNDYEALLARVIKIEGGTA